jgi:hypothetical protein
LINYGFGLFWQIELNDLCLEKYQLILALVSASVALLRDLFEEILLFLLL